MQLRTAQLHRLNGAFAPEKPDPVIERLNRLEALVNNLPVPSPPVNLDGLSTSTAAILERLARLEKIVVSLSSRPSSFEFEIMRDGNGKMVRVRATKAFNEDGPKAVVIGNGRVTR